MSKKKKSAELRKKTIRYIITYLCCLLVAVFTWLFVDMYTESKSADPDEEKAETVSFELWADTEIVL